MLRVALIIITLTALAYGTFFNLTQKDREEPFSCHNCNVILISIDTLGAKHTSLYNPEKTTTPFLQELGNKSVVFENAYSQAPWTLPSHTAMLTGRYPWDLGVWQPTDILPPQTHTIAESLQEIGYHTAAFSNGSFVRPERGFNKGFEEFFGSVAFSAWEDIPMLFNDASAWITTYESDQPFFLFLRPFGVHDPYVTEQGTVDIHNIVEANTKEEYGKTAEFLSAYEEGVKETDSALRAFFQTLETQGLLDTTIVIITADHGEEFGEHGSIAMHATALYPESIHVPLIVYVPHATPTRFSETVEIRSIPATIKELLNTPTEPAFQAASLVPIMKGIEKNDRLVLARTALTRTTLLATIEGAYEAFEKDSNTTPLLLRKTPYNGPFTATALQGNWQLIKTGGDTYEVYDLAHDPEAARNKGFTVAASLQDPILMTLYSALSLSF